MKSANWTISCPIYGGLPDAEKDRLQKQCYFMEQYSAVLGERIAAF
jgi:hypothetical protein